MKPKETDFEPQCLGDHIKRVRLERGLRQVDVARILNVNPWTLCNWENGYTEPVVERYPAIMAFLGYCPYQRGDTLAKQIFLHRIHRGLSHRELARLIAVDPGSISRWETGDRTPTKNMRRVLEQFFETKSGAPALWRIKHAAAVTGGS